MYVCHFLFRNSENFVNFEKSGQKSTDHVSKGQGQNVRVWSDKWTRSVPDRFLWYMCHLRPREATTKVKWNFINGQ